MALLALSRQTLKPAKDDRNARERERKAAIQSILEADEGLRQKVGAAQAASEEQDQHVKAIEDSPIRLAELGEDGYDAALSERTTRRMALGRALLKQTAYREQHDLDALRSELAGIEASERAEAQQAHRQKVGAAALAVLADLRRAGEAYHAYCDLIDEAYAAWPREAEAVLRDFPLLPPGVLSPNGSRSIQGFWSDKMMLADRTLLTEDDPGRARHEDAVQRTGQPPVLYIPGLVWSS